MGKLMCYCYRWQTKIHQESNLHFFHHHPSSADIPSNQCEISKLPSDKYLSYIKIYKITSDSLREEKLHYNHLGKNLTEQLIKYSVKYLVHFPKA